MDQSDHLERLKRIETLFAIVVGETVPKSAQDATIPEGACCSRASEGGTDAAAVASSSVLPTCTTTVDVCRLLHEEQELAATDARVLHPQAQRPGLAVQNVPRTEKEDRGSLDSERVKGICVQEQSELEQVELHASAAVAAAERFCRRRQSLAYLLYRGLAAVYRDVRAVARRVFVSECAADIGRIKQLASSSSSSSCSLCSGGGEKGSGGGSTSGITSLRIAMEDDGLCSGVADSGNDNSNAVTSSDLVGLATDSEGADETSTAKATTATEAAGVGAAAATAVAAAAAATGPEAARSRESRRVTQQLQNEANRVAVWDKIQREVLRRSTSEVTRLLVADSLRGAPVEGGRSQAGGGAGSIQVSFSSVLYSCKTNARTKHKF